MLYCGIDPSADPHKRGVAFYDSDKRIITADTFEGGSLTESKIHELLRRTDKCVVESPMLYGGHPRPNDIITLAVSAGECGGLFYGLSGCKATFVKPYEWKRQLDKPKCWQRILIMLNKTELMSVSNLQHMTKKRREDVQDAIGLALFGAGRYVF